MMMTYFLQSRYASNSHQGELVMTDESTNNHIYRVDKFIVPASARDDFLARANAIRDILKTQKGFIRDTYLEQFSGPGEFNIVTIAEWESQEHVEQAKVAVATFMQATKFNPQEMYQRLGIKADIAFYKRIDS
jgi:heme-degrading monooxygenase HmoA